MAKTGIDLKGGGWVASISSGHLWGILPISSVLGSMIAKLALHQD